MTTDATPASAKPATLLMWILLAAGAFLRLYHYADNRSLWIDEIYLATSLIRLDFRELATQPLYYQQKAPLGVLWAMRAGVACFGNTEQALRLVPLLSSLAALLLFVPVARCFLRPVGVLVAVGGLALAPPLVYHAVEAKQYSTELLATLCCLWLYLHYPRQRGGWPLLRWGLWGALVVWFSYPAVFVLAAIGLSISLPLVLQRQGRQLLRVALPCLLWAGSFLVHYGWSRAHAADGAWLTYWFEVRGGFMPLLPASPAEMRWFTQALYRLLEYPLGLRWTLAPDGSRPQALVDASLGLLVLTLWAVGSWQLYRRDRPGLLVLTLPVGFTLLASGVHLYPFFERLTVFLAPLLLLLLALGCETVARLIQNRTGKGMVLPVLVVAWPLWSSLRQLRDPGLFGGYKKEYHRENLLFINARFQPGDVVYVYWNLLPAYRFYKEAYPLRFRALEGRDVRFAARTLDEYVRKLEPDRNALQGHPRVWFMYKKWFFTNIGDVEYQPAWYWNAGPYSGRAFHDALVRRGQLLLTHDTKEGNVSLLNLATSDGHAQANAFNATR